MNHEQAITQTEAPQLLAKDRRDEPQPWHRPTLKRLRLSLDTTVDTGSSSDGQWNTTPW